MKSAVQRAMEIAPAPTYVCSIASSPGQLKQLAVEASHLWEKQECTSSLDFFLSTLMGSRWNPLISVVREGGEIIGLVYAKERKLYGLNTGLLYADATLGAMVIAAPYHRAAVFETGVTQLLKRPFVRGFRLLVPPLGYELTTLKKLRSKLGLDLYDMPAENHAVLPMQPTFEEFLESLNRSTRRNFRYFRNKSATANHCFIESVPIDEFRTAALGLLEQDVVGADREGVDRGLNVCRTARRPLLVGLKSATGEWLSVLGGWYEAGRVVVFLQMNSDKKYARHSLSLVMRSHLIEKLIREGHRDLLWWAGVGAPIQHYVRPVPTRWVYMDKKTLAWSAIRRLMHSQRARLPAKFLSIAEWIIPPSEQRVDATSPSSPPDD